MESRKLGKSRGTSLSLGESRQASAPQEAETKMMLRRVEARNTPQLKMGFVRKIRGQCNN